jgi:hypothetical protein
MSTPYHAKYFAYELIPHMAAKVLNDFPAPYLMLALI